MNRSRFGRVVVVATLILGFLAAYFLWPRASPGEGERNGSGTRLAGAYDDATDPRATSSPINPGATPATGSAAVAPSSPRLPYDEADFPIAAPLNAPDSTIARDLDIVSQLFDAWRSNFPREGNPVGENAEITAALMGENPLQFALIPKRHRAVNDRGELCDRWGTPFRLHQLSGSRMEIISAGPDRKFGTADDAVWTPQ